ncbi:MAG TPA: NAD(P)-dependent oxidoreductase [Herpetosiphonaceae bacterium]
MTGLPRIGFIGLGAMGAPMAANLLKAGYPLTVSVHRSREAADRLAEAGAAVVDAPRLLGERSEIVITMVPDAPQVEEALLGPQGAAHTLAAGSVCIDMSTISPVATKRIAAALAERGIEMLDAPVSGGPVRAASGELAIMAGGAEATFARCLPVLQALGKAITHVGGTGAGEVVKLCNNLAISVIAMANLEALALGVANGVPAETVREVLLGATGNNYLLEHWLPGTVFTGDYAKGFASELLAKDLAAVGATARAAGLPLFAGGLAEQLWLRHARQAPRLDYTSLAAFYEESLGRPLRQLPDET